MGIFNPSGLIEDDFSLVGWCIVAGWVIYLGRCEQMPEIIVNDSPLIVMRNGEIVEVGNGNLHAWLGISVGDSTADYD